MIKFKNFLKVEISKFTGFLILTMEGDISKNAQIDVILRHLLCGGDNRFSVFILDNK